MKRKTALIFLSCLFALLPYLLPGCTSIIQKGGEFLEGSAFEEKTLVAYRTAGKDKETIVELRELKTKAMTDVIEITSAAWPGLALRGIMGNGSIQLTEARFLSSHVNGWNEFSLDLLGSVVFQNSGGAGGLLRITGEVERVQISSVKIRLKSRRLTGSEALTALRNRRERILAITGWMGEAPYDKKPYEALQGRAGMKQFEEYWKSRLFPELVSKNKRPLEYSSENANWNRVDSIKWNRNYTEYLLPEELWELRNSGALLRDWEEALPWIYMEYSWDRIINSFDGVTIVNTTLLKAQK